MFSLSGCPSECTDRNGCTSSSKTSCYDFSGPGGGGSGGSLHIRGQFVHVGKQTKLVT